MAKVKKSKIFFKVFIGFFTVFLVTVVSIAFFTQYTLEEHLMSEYRSKGASVAKSISDSSVNLVLNSDPATIQSILNQYLEIKGVAYILVRDSSLKIIAHTFVPGVPSELESVELDQLQKGNLQSGKMFNLKLQEYGDLIEIISPMIIGKIGYVHVGMSLEPINTTIKETILKTLALIIGLFVISIGLLYMFIKQISKPIKLLTSYSNALSNHHFKQPLAMQWDIKQLTKRSKDEIGNLADSFVNLEDKLIQYIQDLETTTVCKEKMESDLKIAHDIQLNMLPNKSILPEGLPIDLEGTLIPAKEVGGDFYDFFVKDNLLCFSVGDVSGKGVPAALFMSASLTMMKATCLHIDSVSDVLTSVNNLLEQRNEHCLFVTVLFGILDMNSGKLTYCNAGHPPPLLFKKDGSFSKLPLTNGMAVGIESGFYYQSNTVTLDQDDTLLLFTDGITEAENVDKDLYGDDRVDALFKQIGVENDCKEINQIVVKDVQAFTAGANQSDDITVLSVRWKGSHVSLKDKVKVHFNNDLQELLKLQKVVEMFSEENNLDVKTTMNVNLILEELLTNTISYGYEDHDHHLIYVTFAIEQGKLLLQLEDDAMAFNPLDREEVDTERTLDDIGIGGLGIHFVKNLVKDISYERKDDKNVLNLGLELQGAQDEDIS
ncbi:hypothetical protein DID80_05440 [Candidatus Marinamargulisbacteria bacterium SCGC AAA071-K20]|nr:hypothetical protein DID80_05440 [Candidatus Marinamargulisbacteria bacterium SCGC AAA071-K20]